MILRENAAMGALLVATSLSFCLQPTNIRFNGVALSIALMGIVICVTLATRLSAIDVRGLLLWVICAVLLLSHDVVDNTNATATTRSVAFLLLLLFAIASQAICVSDRWLRGIWWSCLLVTTVLSAIALWRFYGGAEEVNPEALADPLEVKDRYRYVGISYLPATRNSDAYYFGIGFLVACWGLLRSHRGRVWHSVALILCSAALIGSLSRGAWLAAFAAVAVAYSPPLWLYLLAAAGLGAIFILDTSAIPMLNLVKVGLASILNPEGANKEVHGFYSYSNESRLQIYSDAFDDILRNPLGMGFSGEASYLRTTGAEVVHSENLYFDILLAVGWLGMVLMAAYGTKLFAITGMSSSNKQIALSILIFSGVFALFNSPGDFAFMWFCIGLAFVTYASDKQIAASASIGGSQSERL